MSHPEPFKPGSKAAGCQVLDEIGRGAASIIYLVQEPKTKQIWALKHVHRADAKDQRFLDQAIKEHEIASKLDHPGIRKIYKLVKGRAMMALKDVYVLMEYVDGVSLEQNRPAGVPDALGIFQQTAAALAYMHERGYVHADIKPNNIVVTDDRVVKLIDFGQSCEIGFVKPRIQGTPDYIAPEQVHRRPITPKTDVYNLGATMYWTLTSAHIPTAIPKGESLVGSLDDEFIERATPARELNAQIPPRLEELVMACVEVDPDNRPQDMGKVAERLDLIRAQLMAELKMSSGELAPIEDDQED